MEEEEKILKKKPDASFNRRLSVAKNFEGNITTAKKNVKNFILQGEHDKWGIWQRVLRYIILWYDKQLKSNNIFTNVKINKLKT